MFPYFQYGLIGVILLGELFIRSQSRPGSQKRDCGSFWLVILLFTAGYFLAFQFYPGPDASWGAWCLWLGAALTVGGTAFRSWAVRNLGTYFTKTVKVSADQRVIDTGPYRYIRHPAYTGALASAAGVAVSLGSWRSLICLMVPAVAGMGYRIHVEERALAETLGDPYRAYMRRTKRLIPYLF